ncbi:MAG: hypothetical protein QXU01_01105 [Candidatus Hadarchaeales archaeon]
MSFPQLNWIVEKAAELLEDKVKEGPLSEKDVEIAFEILAKPRMDHIMSSLSGRIKESEARDYIMMKLRERAKLLNTQHWGVSEKI